MSVYGIYNSSQIRQAATNLKVDFVSSGMSAVALNINNTFFGGEVFNPKSYVNLFSITMPSAVLQQIPVRRDTDMDQQPPTATALGEHGEATPVLTTTTQVEVVQCLSFSGIWGYAEGIPVIGSAIAAINVFGHLFCMWIDYSAFSSLATMNPSGQSSTAKLQHYSTVFNTAISYTVHRNAAATSALALIPCAKLVVKVIQALLYSDNSAVVNNQNMSAASAEEMDASISDQVDDKAAPIANGSNNGDNAPTPLDVSAAQL